MTVMLPTLLLAASLTTSAPPNVILIMTDDQGYGDLGVTGNPLIRTPHIDAFARQSASMSTFYVSPVCAPTRACLMTGRYNYRTRAIDTFIGRAMMEPTETTIAELLRDAGYATGIFGKWHLGDCYPMRPMDQGFEMSLVHRGGGIGQPSDPPGGERKYTDAVLFRNGQRVETTGYCTDVYFDAALEWIDETHAAQRPFFTYIATNAPHGPFHDVPEALHRAYAAMDLGNAQFPAGQGHPLPEKANTDARARIFAMITNVDDNVGKLLRHLDARGLAENTLVIFMVDNGPNERRYVAGMRGRKGDVYEGGIRSPFFARWPGRLTPGHASDRIAAHIDLTPTILDACGVTPPPDIAFDGRSLLPLLEGRDVAWPDRPLVIQAHRGNEPVRYHHFMIRDQGWKLLRATGFGRETPKGDPPFELYDMEHDPLEMTDVAAEHPDVAARLKATYDAWFDDVGSTRPDNYAPPRIHLGSPRQNPVTLTRQDWRHTAGRPWAERSVGYWVVRVTRDGAYDVTCRLPKPAAGGAARLRVGADEFTTDVAAGVEVIRFDGVALAAGDADLEVVVTDENGAHGPLLVDVSRR